MSRDLRSVPSSRPALPAPAAALRRRLLAWYRRHGRDLPWRRTRDPYPVWVSEIMLQQTQVATALPYYRRFLDRFPTLESLARAREADVLRAWAGLGYYRRARHLREAAARVVREHGARVPDDPEGFARLPGVGRYTTGAVLSIAYGRALPVVDGNVARVLARLCALPLRLGDPRGARTLWALAASLVPMRDPGDWNQALMELGATVCTPRAPGCEACPLRAPCRARALGRPAAFPPAGPRRAAVTVRRALALVERRGRVLMTRREGALLGGLWEPPGADLGDGRAARPALRAALAALGVRARLSPLAPRIRHGITFRTFDVALWRAEPSAPLPRSARLRLVDPARPGVPLTALARKALRAVRIGGSEAAAGGR